MHPLALLGIWLGVGCLFAFQEYVELRHTPSAVKLQTALTLWALYSSLGAAGFIGSWVLLRRQIQTGGWRFMAGVLLPLSFVLSVAEEMLYVVVFPHFVAPKVQRTYWSRLLMVLSGDFVSNMVFFWAGIVIARGVGYYERLRQKEITTSRLETELAGAQLRALRMQLNPHFLFNTLNGVSSLMRGEPDVADRMLEQLGMLLRMTLDRGDVQEVSLREEMEFTQLYLDIQQARFGDRVRYEMDIAPSTLDSLIPTMILQPIVENAYRHGIACSTGQGRIWIVSAVEGGDLAVRVRNTGEGIRKDDSGRTGVGLANVRSRLQLQYDDRQSFTLRETEPGITEALLKMPMISDASAARRGKEGLRP